MDDGHDARRPDEEDDDKTVLTPEGDVTDQLKTDTTLSLLSPIFLEGYHVE